LGVTTEWAPTLFIWIFTLSIAQIAVNIAVLYSSYKEIHPMLVPFIVIVSIAYLLFIIGLEIYINKKIKVFENIGKLLIAILMFFGVTLTLILQEEKIEVILPYSIFTGLLIIWTIYIYSRKYGRKKKKKGQV
jgi:predicted tellurium resistance membrane protein TerC